MLSTSSVGVLAFFVTLCTSVRMVEPFMWFPQSFDLSEHYLAVPKGKFGSVDLFRGIMRFSVRLQSYLRPFRRLGRLYPNSSRPHGFQSHPFHMYT